MNKAKRTVLTVLLACTSCVSIGCGTPSLLLTPVSGTRELEEIKVDKGDGRIFSSSKVAVIAVEGLLLNVREGGFLQPTENKVSLFAEELQKAADDGSVKAVVLRINSPGGGVTASDRMYGDLLEFKRKTGKPVVAAIGDIGASGAYYVACGSDKIVAEPTAIVGSIGVIFETFDLSGAMGKIGVKSEVVKSGLNKDIASPFKPMTDGERTILQGMIDENYARFRGVVKTKTGLDDATLGALADGRVFTGEQAQKAGLIDQTASLAQAIDIARDLGHIKGAPAVAYRRPYGYSGSIYANTRAGDQQTLALSVPQLGESLPTGFYYLWDHGR